MKLVVHLRFHFKINDSLETLPPKKTEIEVVLKKLRNYERLRIAILRAEATFSGCVNWSATSTEFLRGTQGRFPTECVENTFLDYPEYFL